MATIEHHSKIYECDEDSFLLKIEDWDENWVDYVRSIEGIKEITNEHRELITGVQEYYKKNGVSPCTCDFCAVTTTISYSHMQKIVPSGFSIGVCMIAGLPKPTDYIPITGLPRQLRHYSSR